MYWWRIINGLRSVWILVDIPCDNFSCSLYVLILFEDMSVKGDLLFNFLWFFCLLWLFGDVYKIDYFWWTLNGDLLNYCFVLRYDLSYILLCDFDLLFIFFFLTFLFLWNAFSITFGFRCDSLFFYIVFLVCKLLLTYIINIL